MIRSCAVVGETFGPIDGYQLREINLRRPAPGEVQIDVAIAGVSFVDSLIAAGGYQLKPPLPYVPGTEYSGVISAVGGGVDGFQTGDRVCAVGMGGGYACNAIASAEEVIHLPASMSFEQGAVFRSAYTTAYHALVQRAGIAEGEHVLVLGASGAVAVAAIQLSKAMGCRVIASSSTAAKREFVLAMGADVVLDSKAADWRERVREVTGNRGVDIVIDPVNGSDIERTFRSVAWGGRHLVIGFTAGKISALPTNLPLVKGASLVGVDVRRFAEEDPQTYRTNLSRILDLFESRQLHCRVSRRFALREFLTAVETVSRGEQTGRVVLDMHAESAAQLPSSTV